MEICRPGGGNLAIWVAGMGGVRHVEASIRRVGSPGRVLLPQGVSMKRTIAILTTCGLAAAAAAHPGRRFEVKVVQDKLVAQGYISSGEDDGNGLVRKYWNAIHGHWLNIPDETRAVANLPGFDFLNTSRLGGHDVFARVLGASKWVNPPHDPHHDTMPMLEPLGPGETISIAFQGHTANTDSLGMFPLVTELPPGGFFDIDPLYSIELLPTAVIYVVQVELSTTAPGVAPSDPVHILLSPDGNDMHSRLHHASLFLEQHLGTPTPAPAGLTVLGAGLLMASRRRRA